MTRESFKRVFFCAVLAFVCSAVMQAGTLFVASQTSGTVSAYDSTSGALQAVVASGLRAPTGLALDSASSNLYIADTTAGVVYKYNTLSHALSSFETLGDNSRPFGVAVDGSGNVYVSEQSGWVAKFASGGGAALATQAIAGGMPRGLAYDAFDSRLLLAISNSDSVAWLDLLTLAPTPLVTGDLNNPRFIAVNSGGVFAVTNTSSTTNGGFVTTFLPSGAVTAYNSSNPLFSGLGGPNGIAFSTAAGFPVFLANYFDNDVLKCTGVANCSVFASNIAGATGLAYTSANLSFGDVPEPATFGFLGIGLGVFAFIRRRK